MLVVSAILGTAIRFNYWDSGLVYDSTLIASVGLYAVVLLGSTMAMGVYSTAYREGSVAMAVRTVVSYCLFGCALLSIIYYFAPSLIMGRGVLAFSISISLFLVVPARWLFFKWVDARSIRRRAIVLGVGARARELEQRLQQSGDKRLAKIVAFINASEKSAAGTSATDTSAMDTDATADPAVRVNGEVCAHYDSLPQIASDYNATEIIVALDDRRTAQGVVFPLDELLDCKLSGIRVVEAVTFYERELGIIELNEIRLGWMVFSSGFTSSVTWSLIKRASDILIAAIILILAWPLMVLAALAIICETGRPIFYSQKRVGYNERVFDIYKFRSMHTDAEIEGKAVWAGANDSRVTKVGAVLRNTRIDELPQLYNVLRGDMSIVGPRPERPEFVEGLNESLSFYRERHRVKPGLMGWAQLNYPYGASIEDSAQKLRYDLYYVKNRSLMLDLIIMVQTVQVIILGTGVR